MTLLSRRILLALMTLAMSVAAFFSPSLAERSVQAQGFKLPVTRRPRRYHEFPGQALNTDVSVTNSQEYAYMVHIYSCNTFGALLEKLTGRFIAWVSVGNQDFFVDLDTGSSDLWIVSNDCSSSDCSGVKKYSKISSPSLSLSEKPFRLSYLLGSVTGNIALETVILGPYQVSSQVFALANNTVGLSLSGTGNSGVLGLCFPSAASISVTSGKTLLENLFAHFDESRRFFAFKLGRDSGPNDLSSSFTVGQLDSAIANDTSGFEFTPVSRAGANDYNYWKIPLQYLMIDNVAFPLSPSLVPGARDPIAVLDTGTTLVLGPTTDVDAFWGAVGHGGAARKNVATGMWEVRCERGVIVNFVLGEKGNQRAYAVDPSDISWSDSGSADGWCMGGIQANDKINSGDWLLGDTFLRNVYVTHHGANSTHPPLIGLLNLTDPVAAMNQFRVARGPDSAPPSIQIRRSMPGSSSPRTVTVYVGSGICGFVGGAVLTVIFRVRRGSIGVPARNRNVVAIPNEHDQ